jgi:hypothetical protein
LLPEEAWRHLVITICEKSPAEAAVAIAAAKLQEVVASRHAVSELLPTLPPQKLHWG